MCKVAGLIALLLFVAYFILDFFKPALDKKVDYSDLFGTIITVVIAVFVGYYLPKILRKDESKNALLFKKIEQFLEQYENFEKKYLNISSTSPESVLLIELNKNFKSLSMSFNKLKNIVKTIDSEFYNKYMNHFIKIEAELRRLSRIATWKIPFEVEQRQQIVKIDDIINTELVGLLSKL